MKKMKNDATNCLNKGGCRVTIVLPYGGIDSVVSARMHETKDDTKEVFSVSNVQTSQDESGAYIATEEIWKVEIEDDEVHATSIGIVCLL